MNKVDLELIKKKYLGTLLGGAIGDALGYYVEFESESLIFNTYGKEGITRFPNNEIGQISDDTQMTLFTAVGLLNAYTMKVSTIEDYSNCIYLAYLDWLATQRYSFSSYKTSNNIPNTFLMNYMELYSNRDPGMTCMRALFSGIKGAMNNPLNSSKGCGGVMRVAPVGLVFKDDLEKIDILSGEACAITHGNPLGFIPGAAYSHIIYLLTHYDISIIDAVIDSQSMIKKLFSNYRETEYYTSLIDKAVVLAKSDTVYLDAIHILGEGWVAEETLAIAIYCALIAESDFRKGISTSASHNGDSDSTASLTGAILGARYGVDIIPSDLLDNLELKDLISDVANDLYLTQTNELKNDAWTLKYMLKTYNSK